MELATVHEFSKRQIGLPDQCCPNIGIANQHSTETVVRMQELLEETQAQSEELRVQQTELENLNSELEVQARKNYRLRKKS